MFKKAWLIVLALGFIVSLSAQARVLSYKQWRVRRVQEAKANVQQFQEEYRSIRRRKNVSDQKELVKAKLRQAKMNIEIARELSANDYFVLYLFEKFPNDSKVLAEAARKMSVGEIAEIFQNYRESLERTPGPSPSFDLLALKEESSKN